MTAPHSHIDPRPGALGRQAKIVSDVLGKMLAQRLIDYPEAMEMVRGIAAHHAPQLDQNGATAFLAHALLDSASRWAMRRGQSERDIARCIYAMTDRVQPPTSDELVNAALSLNEDLGGALIKREVLDKIREILTVVMARQDRAQAPHRSKWARR